ncbi:Rv3235 family protein [Streptomyces cirratus]
MPRTSARSDRPASARTGPGLLGDDRHDQDQDHHPPSGPPRPAGPGARRRPRGPHDCSRNACWPSSAAAARSTRSWATRSARRTSNSSRWPPRTPSATASPRSCATAAASTPGPGVIEAFARVATGDRVSAMAFRLELGPDLRWRCAAIEIHGPRP